MRRQNAIAAMLLFFAAAAVAQVPTAGNVFLGYSYNRGSTGVTNTGNLNGWEASLEGKMLPHVALVADYSDTTGSLFVNVHPMNVDYRVQSFLFGPRLSLSVGRYRPFAHVLIGVSRMHQYRYLAHAENSFGDAVGGGVDYSVGPHLAWRFQADALRTGFHGGHQNDFRFATGPVVRF